LKILQTFLENFIHLPIFKFLKKKNEIEKLESNCRPAVRYETQRNEQFETKSPLRRSPLPGSPVSGNTAGCAGPPVRVCVFQQSRPVPGGA